MASLEAASLRDSIGRNQVKVWAAPFVPALGATVEELRLADRLDRQGYRRVRERPGRPGEYFWGFDNFWIYRRATPGRPARLLGLALERPDGTVVGYRRDADAPASTRRRDAIELEPVLLAESLRERRSIAPWVPFDDIPEPVWRAVLAIEDNRFFDHRGVDGRAVARALLANLKSGSVVQGGSTITQQLIKLRDLSPKRSLGRKASEAARALALEAEHSKEEILEAYLNSVYFGHLDGIQIYGIEAAAGAFYSTSASELDLRQGAVLAAMVQAPNRMSPLADGDRLPSRYRRVLDRLEELEWIAPEAAAAARRSLPPTRRRTPRTALAPHYLQWLAAELGDDRGLSIEATLDAELQRAAESAVRGGLDDLRRRRPALASRSLSAALVAIDATSGDVLAYVGGDPAAAPGFDRARRGRRQPGSTVKPFVALEALESCGRHPALFGSRRVVDQPLTLELPSGAWAPQNSDRTFRGTVTVRDALAQSMNVPIVRIARHCGFDAVASRMRRAGLTLPADVQPAFVLGAVETTPLELATAYTVFLNGGDLRRARPLRSARRASGRPLLRRSGGRRHVASAAATYTVWELLERPELGGGGFGKTGTSSAERDAWYAGGAGRVVAAVWVGLDDDRPLGFSGAEAARPIWDAFVRGAAPTRGPHRPSRPSSLVDEWVDVRSGLRLARQRDGAESFVFRRKSRPPKRRLWRRQSPLAPIE